MQVEQPFYQLYSLRRGGVYELRELTLRKGDTLAEVFLVYSYYFGNFIVYRFYVVGYGERFAVGAEFIQERLVRPALSLYVAFDEIGLALAVREYVEGELYVEFVALIINLVELIGIALYVAVQRKVYRVEYRALAAARFAEDSEDSALQKGREIYNRPFGEAVEPFEFKSYRFHSSSVSERKSARRSDGTSAPKRDE